MLVTIFGHFMGNGEQYSIWPIKISCLFVCFFDIFTQKTHRCGRFSLNFNQDYNDFLNYNLDSTKAVFAV